MAGSSLSNSAKNVIRTEALRLQEGLEALHELANAEEHAVTWETLSTCVEQMTLAMQGRVARIMEEALHDG